MSSSDTIAPTTATIAEDCDRIDTVLLKVASRCNISCRYCYVYEMGDDAWRTLPRSMSPEIVGLTASALAGVYARQKSPFAVVIHGGEPLLLGQRRLEGTLRVLRDSLDESIPICVQTNGTLITDRILDICTRYRTSVSVSLDGPDDVHDADRVDHAGTGTHGRVAAGLDRLRTHPDREFLYTGVLAVINPQSDPESVYNHLKSFDPPSIDFLYRDGNHSRLPKGKSSLESTEFGEWLCRMLDVYVADDSPPRVRILDDLLRLIMGSHSTKEGVGLTDYGIVVVDTDGTIAKNDTLKSTFAGADRFVTEWHVRTNPIAEVVQSEEFRAYRMAQRPSSAVCSACPEVHICGGGMTLHRWRDDSAFDNPSVYCADQKLLIRHVRRVLSEAA